MNMRRTVCLGILFLAGFSASGCSSSADESSDASYRAEVTKGMHDSLALEIADWKKAAT